MFQLLELPEQVFVFPQLKLPSINNHDLMTQCDALIYLTVVVIRCILHITDHTKHPTGLRTRQTELNFITILYFTHHMLGVELFFTAKMQLGDI